MGSGKKSTTIVGNANHYTFIVPGTKTNIYHFGKLTDLTINGGSKTNTNCIGIRIDWANRYSFKDIEIKNCYIGIFFANVWQVTLYNIYVLGYPDEQCNIGFYGGDVDTDNQVNSVYATNCIAENIVLYGFRLVNFNNSKFVNCEAIGGQAGFYLGAPTLSTSSSQYIRFGQFMNCIANSNSFTGWVLDKGNANSFKHTTFVSCQANNTIKGWYVKNCDEIVISESLVLGTNSLITGMEFINCNRSTVTGCVISNYNSYGIVLQDTFYFNITGNQITSDVSGITGIAEGGNSNGNLGTGNIIRGGVRRNLGPDFFSEFTTASGQINKV